MSAETITGLEPVIPVIRRIQRVENQVTQILKQESEMTVSELSDLVSDVWVGTATSNLDMNGHNISNVGRLGGDDGPIAMNSGFNMDFNSITGIAGLYGTVNVVPFPVGAQITTTLILLSLPSSDPAVLGQVYNNSGTLKISAGP